MGELRFLVATLVMRVLVSLTTTVATVAALGFLVVLVVMRVFGDQGQSELVTVAQR